jgi:CHASE2 domain-containing sensor protein
MGWSLYRWWFQVLGNVGVEANVLNASITGALTRNPPASALSWPWVAVFGAVAAATVLVMFFSKDDDRRWAVALAGGLLLSPLGWVYYLPLVAAPVVALAKRSIVFRCCLILALLAFAVPFSRDRREQMFPAAMCLALELLRKMLVEFLAAGEESRSEG